MRLQVLALVAAGAVALLLAAAAGAKDWLSFDRTAAHPGDTVRATTPYTQHQRGLVVYLVPLAASPRFWRIGYTNDYMPKPGPAPRVRGAVLLGRAKASGRGATLTFDVPHVRPGRYVLGVYCRPCNTHWTSALPNYQPDPHGILRVL